MTDTGPPDDEENQPPARENQPPARENQPPARDPRPSDAIRVVGAENAAEAAEEGDGRPVPKPDPGQFGAVPVISSEGTLPEGVEPAGPTDDTQPSDTPVAEGTDLPHWTEPPSGQVPVVGGDGEPGDAWATSSGGARWRGQGEDWEADDFSDLAPEGQIIGDEAAASPPEATTSAESEDVVEIDDLSDDRPEPEAPSGGAPQRPVDPYPEDARAEGLAAGAAALGGGDRDMGTAVAVGVGMAVAFIVALFVAPAAAVVLVAGIAAFATGEFYEATRKAGYHPAPLVGLVGSACMVLGVYWRGEAAFPLVAVLLVVTAMAWWLLELGGDRAVPNMAITVFGALWIGGMASFAALLLKFPDDGAGMLFGAVLVAVVADTAGLLVGQRVGSSPLSAASPNKTIEGLVGGGVAAIAVSLVVLGVIGVHPWDTSSALALGLVGAVLTPLGDLCVSRIKRDLGVKDMGHVLPAHGGLLDRFDGLLFVLPAAYYVVRVFEVFANT